MGKHILMSKVYVPIQENFYKLSIIYEYETPVIQNLLNVTSEVSSRIIIILTEEHNLNNLQEY